MYKEFPFPIDEKLKHKLDLLALRLEQDDIWIIIDGKEGSGKTNMLVYILYYYYCLLGRKFDETCLYFNAEDLLSNAQKEVGALLGWDEAALDGLSSEWWNSAQRNIIKLAMTARKKHHIFILCIPKVFKLAEYLREDRSHALIHMRVKKPRQKGCYMYLTERGKALLCRIFKAKKIKAYAKCMKNCNGFGGHIPYVRDKIPEFNDGAYENNKDLAIAGIGQKKTSPDRLALRNLKARIGRVRCPVQTRKELADKMGMDDGTLSDWSKLPLEDTENE